MSSSTHRAQVCDPLNVTKYYCNFDISFRVTGSGVKSQAEACQLALSKCIYKFDPTTYDQLTEMNYLTTNPKKVERKKTGLYKARAKYPYKRR